MRFGEYLKKMRERKGYSIRQLASYSGVSDSYLSQIETGKSGVPKPAILRKLASPLGVDYKELLRAAGYLPDEAPSEPPRKEVTLEEALHELLDSDHVMFDGLPVGEFDEETKEDLLEIVRAMLEHRARQRAVRRDAPAGSPKKAAAAAKADARVKRTALSLAAAV